MLSMALAYASVGRDGSTPTLTDTCCAFSGSVSYRSTHARIPVLCRSAGTEGMPMDEPYFFDVLPVHPQPRYLESLTGYLMRLAENNRITSIASMIHLVDAHRRARHWVTDSPRTSYGSLPLAACCSEDSLRATTFYHLAEKYSRGTQPGPLGTFLAGSISPHLRYCPQCLAHDGYHRLPWRFIGLAGCPYHGCQLADRCHCCGGSIPILLRRPRIGVCPHCGTDLRDGTSAPLSPRELEAARRCYDDLAFLLLPTPSESGLKCSAHHVGLAFTYMRLVLKLTPAAAARQIGTSSQHVLAVERATATAGRLLFSDYLAYASMLGRTQYEMFSTEALSPRRGSEPVARPRAKTGERSRLISLLHEDALVTLTQTAFETLKTTGQIVTQEGVGRLVGRSPTSLSFHRRVRDILRDVDEYRHAQLPQYAAARDDELTARVVQATERLRHEKKLVSISAVSAEVGMDVYKLAERHLRIRRICDNLKHEIHRERAEAKKQREASLARRILAAETELCAQHRNPTPSMIMSLLGVNIHTAGTQAKPAEALAAVRARHRERTLQAWYGRESALVERILESPTILRARGERVSKAAISLLVGVPVHTLTRFPKVRAALNRVAASCRNHPSPKRLDGDRVRAERLLDAVRSAIADLQNSDRPVTCRAIKVATRLSWSTLMRYPKVRVTIQRALRAAREERARRRRERDQQLGAALPDVVSRLQHAGRPVTIQAVCRTVGMATTALSRYPRFRGAVYAAMREVRQASQRAYKEKLLDQVREVVAYARSLGLPVSQARILAITRMDFFTLHRRSDLLEIVNQATQAQGRCRKQGLQTGNEVLRDAVSAAIAHLQSAGVTATEDAVRQNVILGLRDGVKFYPLYRDALHTLITEELLLRRVLDAIDALRSQRLPITKRAIAASAGLSRYSLKRPRSPRLQNLLMQVVAESEVLRRQARAQRQQHLSLDVDNALDRLKAEDRPITLTAVAAAIGVSPATLAHNCAGVHERVRRLREEQQQSWRKEGQAKRPGGELHRER